MKLSLTFLALVGATSIALAAPAPLPNSPSYIGIDQTISLNSYIAAAGAGGGQFDGTVNSFETSFWCVDSQESFSFGNTGLADIVQLSNIPSVPSEVRYGNISTSNTSATNHWTNNIGTGFDSAQTRYEMAAYLVSQYAGFSSTIGNTASNPKDTIQEAIWDLTNNNTVSDAGINTTPINLASTDHTTVGYWINQAELNYNTVNLNQWAVVSWLANPDGSLAAGKQTFLVQVAATPEPRFYGFLMLAMIGLCFLVRRSQASKA